MGFMLDKFYAIMFPLILLTILSLSQKAFIYNFDMSSKETFNIMDQYHNIDSKKFFVSAGFWILFFCLLSYIVYSRYRNRVNDLINLLFFVDMVSVFAMNGIVIDLSFENYFKSPLLQTIFFVVYFVFVFFLSFGFFRNKFRTRTKNLILIFFYFTNASNIVHLIKPVAVSVLVCSVVFELYLKFKYDFPRFLISNANIENTDFPIILYKVSSRYLSAPDFFFCAIVLMSGSYTFLGYILPVFCVFIGYLSTVFLPVHRKSLNFTLVVIALFSLTTLFECQMSNNTANLFLLV